MGPEVEAGALLAAAVADPALGAEDGFDVALGDGWAGGAGGFAGVEGALFDPPAEGIDFGGGEFGAGDGHASGGDHAEQETVVGLAGEDGGAGVAAAKEGVAGGEGEARLGGFVAVAGDAFGSEDGQDVGGEAGVGRGGDGEQQRKSKSAG